MYPTAQRILCIEPTPDTCGVVQALLRARGYESDSAVTVAEALAKARGARYSLYILDDGYRDGTNAELAAGLRALTPSTPIIFLTTHTYGSSREEAFAAGASAFLPLPGGLLELSQTVALLLGPTPAPG